MPRSLLAVVSTAAFVTCAPLYAAVTNLVFNGELDDPIGVQWELSTAQIAENATDSTGCDPDSGSLKVTNSSGGGSAFVVATRCVGGIVAGTSYSATALANFLVPPNGKRARCRCSSRGGRSRTAAARGSARTAATPS
jgi:hypothetical protein